MVNWADYLAVFHTDRPGVTESVLRRCVAGHHTPYSWLARAVSRRATLVVDIGCGSGAMSRELEQPGRTVIGLDLSSSELTAAAARSSGPWVQADARALPFADNSVDAVVSALGLPVIQPTTLWLSEVSRVLKPGGVLAGLVPTIRPVSLHDMLVAGQLATRLRSQPQFPVSIELATKQMLSSVGLRKNEDARERYHFVVRSRADADLLLSALYLPDTHPERVEDAASWLATEVVRDGEVRVPIPMRRLVAMK